MSDIDLRSDKRGGSWTRSFGAHERSARVWHGFEVAINDISAHVTPKAMGIKFVVDRHDVPSAWESPIDVDKLLVELTATIARHMSPAFMGELMRVMNARTERAFREGEESAREKMRSAIGL